MRSAKVQELREYHAKQCRGSGDDRQQPAEQRPKAEEVAVDGDGEHSGETVSAVLSTGDMQQAGPPRAQAQPARAGAEAKALRADDILQSGPPWTQAQPAGTGAEAKALEAGNRQQSGPPTWTQAQPARAGAEEEVLSAGDRQWAGPPWTEAQVPPSPVLNHLPL